MDLQAPRKVLKEWKEKKNEEENDIKKESYAFSATFTQNKWEFDSKKLLSICKYMRLLMTITKREGMHH